MSVTDLAILSALTTATLGLFGMLSGRDRLRRLLSLQLLLGGAALTMVAFAGASGPLRLADPGGPHALALVAVGLVAILAVVGLTLSRRSGDREASHRRRTPPRRESPS